MQEFASPAFRIVMYARQILLARSVKLAITGITFIFIVRLAVLTVLLARSYIFHISTSNVHLVYQVKNKDNF